MKTQNNTLPAALDVPMCLLPFLGFTFDAPKAAPELRPTFEEEIRPRQEIAPALDPNAVAAPLIFAVDDELHLTELYTVLLEPAGCEVRVFNDRVNALRALRREKRRPDLLITDYIGNSMLAEHFISGCLKVCPGLRVLMASGLNQCDLRFAFVRPVQFLQKPFTAEEFLCKVKVALATDLDDSSSGLN